MANRTIAFSIDPDADRDILSWLDSQGNKSDAIRKAIRAFVGSGLTLGDIYQEIVEVKRMLKNGVVTIHEDGGDDDLMQDDPEIAGVESVLDTLGL